MLNLPIKKLHLAKSPYSLLVVFIFVVVLSTPITSIAQDESANAALRYHFGLEAGEVFLKPEFADAYGTDEVGRSWIRLHSGLIFYRFVFFDAGFGIFNVSDKDPFYQSVTNPNLPFANSNYESSKLVSGEFYAAIGFLIPISKQFRVGLLGGNSRMDMSRTISGCDNCVKQVIPIEAGRYMEYRLAYDSSASNKLIGQTYLSYRKFNEDSDVDMAGYLGFTISKPF